MSAVIKWDSLNNILKRRGLEERGRVQQFVGSEVAKHNDKYVPLRLGPLKKTVQVLDGGKEVRYIQPYAASQYYSSRKPGSSTGPLRGPKWFERMKSAVGKEIIRGAANLAGGKT